MHVAAQVEQLQVGAQPGELHPAAQAAGANARALWQCGEAGVVVADEGVVRVFARQDGGDAETVGQVHADVFHRMDGDIGLAARYRLFQLFDKEAFAADAGEWCVQDLVAACRHRYEADGDVRVMRAQAVGDVFGLPEGKPAFAGGDADFADVCGHAVVECAEISRSLLYA